MAHFILEYSANLDVKKLALSELFCKLHDEAFKTGLFPLAGMRSRAHRAEDYRVANGDPNFAFVHLNFRIGAGRTEEEKMRAFEVLRDALIKHCDDLYHSQGLAISFELTELPEKLRHNHNNLRLYMS